LSFKLGILGGTFNPIHYGHLSAAETIRERLNLSKILFIPSYQPPHKHEADIPSAQHRMNMIELAIAGNPAFESSDIEITRRGKSFTIDTIEALVRRQPQAELYFIIGIDSFLEIRTWHQWERLLALCSFVVISRPGFRFADLEKIDFMRQAEDDLARLDRGACSQAILKAGAYTVILEMIPLHDISSTDIRKRLKAHESTKYLLPAEVETYIIGHNLYAELS